MIRSLKGRDADGTAFRVLVADVTEVDDVVISQDGVVAEAVEVVFGSDGVVSKVSTGRPFPVDAAALTALVSDLLVAGSGDVASTLTDGRATVTTPGTAVAIRASLACKWVTVTALKTNTDQVNVGGSGVLATSGSSKGTPLTAGQSMTIPVVNADLVFVDARAAGEGVSFTVGS